MAEDKQPDWRDEPIDYGRWTEWLRENRHGVVLLGVGFVIIIFGFVFLYPAESRTVRQLVSDLYANGGAEFVSIAITVLIVDSLNRQRSKRDEELREKQFRQEAEVREKADLILQMGSPDNAFAREAVRKLRARGWLFDGSLQKADLFKANLCDAELNMANLSQINLNWVELCKSQLKRADLSKASLREADLREVDMVQANLREADLRAANLTRANLHWGDLHRANLSQAVLIMADLRESNLNEANLYWANLRQADLSRADLRSADLYGAFLTKTNLNEANLNGTIMPNGEEWYEGMDLEQFTNP